MITQEQADELDHLFTVALTARVVGSVPEQQRAQKAFTEYLSQLTHVSAPAVVKKVPTLAEVYKELAMAWSVCASIHNKFAKGRDALFSTRQADYAKHEDTALKNYVQLTGESNAQ